MPEPIRQNVLKDFPAYLDKLAEQEDFELLPWQRQIVEAFAEGKQVRVYAAPSRQAGTKWLYEQLRRYLEELDAQADERKTQ